MKRILILLILLSFTFGQNDNIGSEAVKKTFDANLHLPRDRAFSSGVLVVLRSLEDGASIDSSGMAISDTSIGARAGAHLIQDGSVFYASAADIDLLLGFTDSGYSIVIDSSGYLLDVPRTVYGWSHDLTFSATDYNTIAWTSGDLYFANKDTFEIVSGNTGDISDPTWIYFDEGVSATVLQTTTTSGNSVGLGRIIVCVGEDVTSPKNAVFQVFGNSGNGVLILADNIIANTITFNEIAGNTIRTNELSFTPVEDDNVIAYINASSEGGGTLNIVGGKIQITGATTFAANYDPSDGSMVIYQFSAPGTRPSGDALQNGDSWVDTTSAQGNIPKIWTGSEWRIAFTYIHGGYIKTGTVDADRLDVSGIITAGSIIVGGDNISDLTNDENFKTVIRADAEPTYTDYNIGDIWIDTNDGDRPYTRGVSGWVAALTIIDGGNISTGTVDADYIDVGGIFAKDMTISGSGELHSDGKDSYADNTAGFWLGYDSGAADWLFNIGDATNSLKWNSNSLAIKGNVTLGATNYINTTGKTSYADTDAGFFLGYDSGAYKLNIGNATDNLKWDGSDLYLNDVIIDDATQTAGTITAATIQTAASGDRVVLSPTGLAIHNSIATGSAAKLYFYDGETAMSYFASTTAEGTYFNNLQNTDFVIYSDVSIHGYLAVSGSIRALSDIRIQERASAPTHIAGHGKYWVDNSAHTRPRFTTDTDLDDVIMTVDIRTETGHPSAWEGRIELNTFDNKIYMYAEGNWRQLATW